MEIEVKDVKASQLCVRPLTLWVERGKRRPKETEGSKSLAHTRAHLDSRLSHTVSELHNHQHRPS
jgi:hypothetical protein